MSIRTRLTLGVGLAICLAACTSPLLRISGEAPPDIDRSQGRPISASACGFQLIQLIPISTNGRQVAAYEALKSQAEGAFIGDVVVTEKWYYAVIGSVYCTQYDAKAYPRRAS
jgi:hypothetical protein